VALSGQKMRSVFFKLHSPTATTTGPCDVRKCITTHTVAQVCIHCCILFTRIAAGIKTLVCVHKPHTDCQCSFQHAHTHARTRAHTDTHTHTCAHRASHTDVKTHPSLYTHTHHPSSASIIKNIHTDTGRHTHTHTLNTKKIYFPGNKANVYFLFMSTRS